MKRERDHAPLVAAVPEDGVNLADARVAKRAADIPLVGAGAITLGGRCRVDGLPKQELHDVLGVAHVAGKDQRRQMNFVVEHVANLVFPARERPKQWQRRGAAIMIVEQRLEQLQGRSDFCASPYAMCVYCVCVVCVCVCVCVCVYVCVCACVCVCVLSMRVCVVCMCS